MPVLPNNAHEGLCYPGILILIYDLERKSVLAISETENSHTSCNIVENAACEDMIREQQDFWMLQR